MKFEINALGYTVEGDVDPDDSWDRPDTDFYLEGWQFVSDFGYRPFDLDVSAGDTVWFVYADHNSGDTFGHDDSLVTVIDVFKTEQEAESLKKALLGESVIVTRGRQKVDTTYGVQHNGKDYYRFWVGYFESLNSMNVETITVV